jgi:hypothetical protein
MLTPIAANKVRALVLPISTALSRDVDGLEVLTLSDYAVADSLLHRIATARSVVSEKLNPILQPLEEAVKLSKQALKAGRTLYEELDSPLQKCELITRQRMNTYLIETQRQREEAERAARQEAEMLQREAEEKQRQAERAKTQQMRDRLASQSAALQQDAIRASSAPVPVLTRQEHSSTRKVRRWRVSDMHAVLRGCSDGSIPPQILTVDSNQMSQYSLDEVSAWPGFEVYTDVTVVRR